VLIDISYGTDGAGAWEWRRYKDSWRWWKRYGLGFRGGL